ncbi:MAG: cysteine desulfurase-like protein [Cytophagales bacterium CG12_big_fil_rev_8_21_14_0_65_40_12]|nr:MAG: cysteine desulfurase-like protein [Cytophagales bacterium CG12_big_fil_rev_8_21_14_0_65_40_12]PIW04189.1 MAG: cysteine desulfurase-like protein [Cytophagales bacterium CG17_big_fil_post_rev_8_21_14_2_50_40_13]
MNTPQLDLNFVRSYFPALKSGFVYMDNAGGSQTLKPVVDRLSEYLLNYDVQHGASYEISRLAVEKVDYATNEMAKLINANDPKEIVMGHSSTMMFRILSLTISKNWEAGDEVITTNSEHESNCSPWMDLQERGIVVKIWKVNPDSLEFEIEDLKKLLSPKTKLVTMVHASNILGTINPIAEVAKVVHQGGALLCVDGVALAPHRLVDVQALDVDFYVFSCYKVYGPHCSLMYGKLHLLEALAGINHYFINEVPYKLQPGNRNFELTYSMAGLTDYLKEVHDHHYPNDTKIDDQEKFQKSFDLFTAHEELLANRFIDFLKTKKSITLLGVQSGDRKKRVPTIAFHHASLKSEAIVKQVDPHRIGIRFGDFYAKKLVQSLNLEAKGGPVRVSFVHYNTLEEVDRLIGVLDKFL